MNTLPDTFTIGALAKAAGVNVETIRFYQRKGLLPEPARAHGSIRRYAQADFARLHFIKSAQRLGFTLEEIAQLLRLEDGTHCGEARALAEEKLADVRVRLRDLRNIESALAYLVRGCRTAKATVACPLIEALQKGA
jgi:MerR family mercuric resistance operon transcriptional regulator